MPESRLVYELPSDPTPELNDGDVYIVKNSHGVFLQEYAALTSQTSVPTWRESDDPVLRLNPVYIRNGIWLHDVVSNLPTNVLREVLEDMKEEQNMHTPLRVPQRGTWCYKIYSRQSSYPTTITQVKRMMLSKICCRQVQDIPECRCLGQTHILDTALQLPENRERYR